MIIYCIQCDCARRSYIFPLITTLIHFGLVAGVILALIKFNLFRMDKLSQMLKGTSEHKKIAQMEFEDKNYNYFLEKLIAYIAPALKETFLEIPFNCIHKYYVLHSCTVEQMIDCVKEAVAKLGKDFLKNIIPKKESIESIQPSFGGNEIDLIDKDAVILIKTQSRT